VRKYFLYGLIAVILIACNVSDPFDTAEFHERGDRVINDLGQAFVDIAGELFEVEIAQSPDAMQIGLSGRPYMADSSGMLFVFEIPGMHNFWMKDMEFPLDFVWIDSNCLVAELTENISHVQDLGTADIAIYSPSTPIKYVLEINGGISEVSGLQIGQQVRFLGNIQAKFGC